MPLWLDSGRGFLVALVISRVRCPLTLRFFTTAICCNGVYTPDWINLHTQCDSHILLTSPHSSVNLTYTSAASQSDLPTPSSRLSV